MEVYPEHEDQLTKDGLQITGTDKNGEARILELVAHPLFLGTLFVPQAKSESTSPDFGVLLYCRTEWLISRFAP
jgi:CTP synthase (UTP-ammonia lyase)